VIVLFLRDMMEEVDQLLGIMTKMKKKEKENDDLGRGTMRRRA